MVSGHIKALVPLQREILTHESSEDKPQNFKYRRGTSEKIVEKSIFGVLTKFQVGHVPNLNICFNYTDESGNTSIGMDTYAYKTVLTAGYVDVNLDQELLK